jgi:hypothetical protein
MSVVHKLDRTLGLDLILHTPEGDMSQPSQPRSDGLLAAAARAARLALLGGQQRVTLPEGDVESAP